MRRSSSANALEVLGGRTRTSNNTEQVMVEGVIKTVTAAGITFTLPRWDRGKHVYGPVPYPKFPATIDAVVSATAVGDHGTHTHIVSVDIPQPVAGDLCLVVYVGPRATHPWWCVQWWPA